MTTESAKPKADGAESLSTVGLGGWVPCEERLPQDGQTVAFVVKAERMLGYMNGRVLGGRFHAGPGGANFSVPGLAVDAWYWMPLPDAPALTLNVELTGAARHERE